MGAKKIPIGNILAMVRHRPKERFDHVAIGTLKELNAYIDYFDPIFSLTEVRRIADHLLRLNNERL